MEQEQLLHHPSTEKIIRKLKKKLNNKNVMGTEKRLIINRWVSKDVDGFDSSYIRSGKHLIYEGTARKLLVKALSEMFPNAEFHVVKKRIPHKTLFGWRYINTRYITYKVIMKENSKIAFEA